VADAATTQVLTGRVTIEGARVGFER